MVSCVDAVKMSFAKSSSRVLIAETPRPPRRCTVDRGRLTLDVAEVGEGIRAVLLLDEVLDVDLVGHIFDARMTFVAVFLLDLLELLLDDREDVRVARKDILKACDAAFEVPCTRR